MLDTLDEERHQGVGAFGAGFQAGEQLADPGRVAALAQGCQAGALRRLDGRVHLQALQLDLLFNGVGIDAHHHLLAAFDAALVAIGSLLDLALDVAAFNG